MEEIFESMTETFTSEEEKLLTAKGQRSAAKAYMKYKKYFGENGCHPSLELFREIRFLNPERALGLNLHLPIETITEFAEVPKPEVEVYKQLARVFNDNCGNDSSYTETLREILNFWKGFETLMPSLAKLAFKFAFLISSSATVERSFSKLDKILKEDRKSLNSENLKCLLFLYFNSGKLNVC